MILKSLLACSLLATGCASSDLAPLAVDGAELHPSLVTRQLEDVPSFHVDPGVLRGNPFVSTDAEFVSAIGRSSSQGDLRGEGVRAALYALYLAEEELGLYGLEAETTADADRLEDTLRGIWAHNERLGRASVHRAGEVLVVAWHDGVSPGCWEAVNARVAELLNAP